MSPKLPVITAQKLSKALHQLGFYIHHQTGSHAQLKHPDGRRTTLPIHHTKDIPKGTLKAILRDINISVEELIQIL